MRTVNPVVDIVEGTNLIDLKDNSRTSLTDSGHITSSENRIPSRQEENSLRQHRDISSIKRDVSCSISVVPNSNLSLCLLCIFPSG